MPGLVDNRFNLIAVVREALSVGPQRLANGLFLEDRCALPDQTSLFSASDGRAFVLANRDWDSADKRETVFDAHVSGYSRRRSACCRMGPQPGDIGCDPSRRPASSGYQVHRQPVGRANPAMSFSAVSQ